MNASYVRDNYFYWSTTVHKNRLYAKAGKDNYNNGDRSPSPTIYPFGMNTQGGFCDLAVLSLKHMVKQEIQTFFGYEKKIGLA
jgi:hypothetical protein